MPLNKHSTTTQHDKEPSRLFRLYMVSLGLSIFFFPLNTYAAIITRWITIILSGVYLFSRENRHILKTIEKPLELKLLILFCFTYMISFVFSVSISDSLIALFYDSCSILLMFSLFFMFSSPEGKALGQNNFIKQRIKTIAVYLLPVPVFIVALYVLITFSFNLENLPRVHGILGSKYIIYQSSSLSLLALSLFSLAYVNRRLLVRAYLAFSGLSALFLVFAGQTRMHIIALCFSILLLILLLFKTANRRARIFIFLAMVLFISVTGSFVYSQKNIRNRIAMTAAGLAESYTMLMGNKKAHGNDARRVGFYKASIDTVLERPLTGTGPYGWNKYLYHKTEIISNHVKKEGGWEHMHPHNNLLHILSEIGIPGFMLYIAVIMLILLKTVRKIFSIHKPDILLYGCATVFLFFTISGISDRTMFYRWVSPAAWSNIALLMLLINKRE